MLVTDRHKYYASGVLRQASNIKVKKHLNLLVERTMALGAPS